MRKKNKYVCYYCGSKNTGFYKTIDNFSLFKCKNCLLLQTYLQGLSLEKINKSKYSSKYLDNYENILSKRLNNNFRKRIKKIDKLVNGGRILDIGCSTGLFLQTLKQYSNNSWEVYGIDINKEAIDKANVKSIGNFFNKSLLDTQFSVNYFNCITCFDILEHDIDLYKTIKIIYKILNKNGVILVQVPNHKSLLASITGNQWDWWCVPDHVYHFELKTIEKVLLSNKFKIIYKSTWTYPYIFIENIRGTMKSKISNPIIKAVLSKLLYIPIIILWIISLILDKYFNTGGLITILAQKI